jgi:bacillithiol biosynthesis cysteine-adding enzyme BshC
MFAATRIPYNQANAFSRIVTDYLSGADTLKPFYGEPPTMEGFEKVLQKKKLQHVDRHTLVSVLREQYNNVTEAGAVTDNINSLLSEETFTVCTAHQPNLFTGPLYFIYKILHTIKLAEELKKKFAGHHFVPVYYMGAEDADFAELNHTWVEGKKIEWKKVQKGAVGRMKVDHTLVSLIDELGGQLLGAPHGAEVIRLLRSSYQQGTTIQQATFELVHELYGAYGLVVLIPDHPRLKAIMKPVFADDLFNNTSSEIVQKTSEKLSEHYTAQAYPREINLFYLKYDIRERIIRKDDVFTVHHTELRFTDEEIREELEKHPERFSPNVILRGLFQETLLPNLAFVGGGGEMAYWLQLKDLFAHYRIIFPILVLRNSFLVVDEKWKGKIDRLGLSLEEIFRPASEIMNTLVHNRTSRTLTLNGNFEMAEKLFEQISEKAGNIDPTLAVHVAALKTRSLKDLHELEKKMLRAEKRKFEDEERQVLRIRENLFPNDGLQERVENFSAFYARWGRKFIDELLKHSLSLEQEFTVLTEEGK